MLGERVRQTVINRGVLQPASGERSQPQDHSSLDGVERGAGGEGIQGIVNVGRAQLGQIRLTEDHTPEQFEEHSAGRHGDHVADRSRQLRAGDASDKIGELAGSLVAPIVADNSCEGCGSGGRLLGCQHQSEDLQQHEADGVVRAAGQAFDERRQVRFNDAQLKGCRYDRQQVRRRLRPATSASIPACCWRCSARRCRRCGRRFCAPAD